MKQKKLENKIVVNNDNGEILGYIKDCDIDLNDYRITYFEVEEKKGLLEKLLPWIFKNKIYQIKINDIESIGNDIILVYVRK